jgi:hypothetical protein
MRRESVRDMVISMRHIARTFDNKRRLLTPSIFESIASRIELAMIRGDIWTLEGDDCGIGAIPHPDDPASRAKSQWENLVSHAARFGIDELTLRETISRRGDGLSAPEPTIKMDHYEKAPEPLAKAKNAFLCTAVYCSNKVLVRPGKDKEYLFTCGNCNADNLTYPAERCKVCGATLNWASVGR